MSEEIKQIVLRIESQVSRIEKKMENVNFEPLKNCQTFQEKTKANGKLIWYLIIGFVTSASVIVRSALLKK